MELDQAARANKKCNQAAEMVPLAMRLWLWYQGKDNSQYLETF